MAELTIGGFKIIIDHNIEKIKFINIPNNIYDALIIFNEDENTNNEFELELASPNSLKFETTIEHIYESMEDDDDDLSILNDKLNKGEAYIICDPECLGVGKHQGRGYYSSTLITFDENKFGNIYTDKDFIAYYNNMQECFEIMFIYNNKFYKIHAFEYAYCCYRPLNDAEIIQYSNNLTAIKGIIHNKTLIDVH